MKKRNKRIIDYINAQYDIENNFHKIEKKIDYNLLFKVKVKKPSRLLYRLGLSMMASSVILLIFNYIYLNNTDATINSTANISTTSTFKTSQTEIGGSITQDIIIEAREFQYQELYYYALINENNKIDEALVGDFIATTNCGDIFYYKSHQTLLKIALLIDDIYYDAVFKGFIDKSSITMEHLIELYNITNSDITEITLIESSHKVICQETNFILINDIYNNLLKSSYDEAGFQQLMYDIYLLSIQSGNNSIKSGNSLTSSGYQGSIKDTYMFILKSEKTEIIFNYYTTRLIHSPKYIEIHGIHYKLNDDLSQWFSNHIED